MIFFIAFIGAITPGPDILLVLRAALANGFKSAFMSLCGIATGWVIYLAILYFGFAHILKGDVAQIALGLCGGIYLTYLAFLLLKAKSNNLDFSKKQQSGYIKGLIINLSNPKAIIFFGIIVTPYMDKNLLFNVILLFLGLISAFLSVIILAVFLKRFITNKLFNIIDKVCGVIFLAFAISLFIMAVEKILEF
ncbi:MAG: LysE family translocator [Helicobacteraceae bacterium]|nr:LysE family translocator [Helicobacteraceae bacterium]